MKCFICATKVTIIEQTMCKCRCSNVYCNKHRMPTQHGCTFHYNFDASKLQPYIASKIT